MSDFFVHPILHYIRSFIINFFHVLIIEENREKNDNETKRFNISHKMLLSRNAYSCPIEIRIYLFSLNLVKKIEKKKKNNFCVGLIEAAKTRNGGRHVVRYVINDLSRISFH